jgi:hypothetical protein
MRKSTGPRLAQDDHAAALLDRIHALAPTQGLGGLGDPTRETIKFLAEHLESGEVCLARHAHGLLQAEIADCLKHCGYVEREDAELLSALKAFAEEGAWYFEDGAWRRGGAVAEVAHA